MSRLPIGTLFLLVTALSMVAQSSPSAMHDMSSMQANSDIIDGARNPELISDLTALRLYFVAASNAANPADKSKSREKAYFAHAGVKAEEVGIASTLLAQFKAQYADLIARYNKEVDRAAVTGNAPHIEDFLQKRDSLVLDTKNALEAALSPESMRSLNAHVQHEKVFMKVAKGENQ